MWKFLFSDDESDCDSNTVVGERPASEISLDEELWKRVARFVYSASGHNALLCASRTLARLHPLPLVVDVCSDGCVGRTVARGDRHVSFDPCVGFSSCSAGVVSSSTVDVPVDVPACSRVPASVEPSGSKRGKKVVALPKNEDVLTTPRFSVTLPRAS